MNINKIVRVIRYIGGLPKSIYVNFRLLPLKEAIYLPIMVSRKTKLLSLSGRAHIKNPRMGIVRIGFGGSDIIDYKYRRTMLRITGDIYFNGKIKIGVATRISVSGELHLGNNFNTSGDSEIVCSKKISIDDDFLMAGKSIIMDTDSHLIYDENKNIINENKEVKIGKHVWIGTQCLILKGSVINDGCIVGANSTISKSYNEKNSILIGNPARIGKKNIIWS